MRKSTKLIGIGAVAVAALLMLMACGVPALQHHNINENTIRWCPHCNGNDGDVCSYVMTGLEVIRESTYTVFTGKGDDLTPEEYEARLIALEAYCTDGTPPGNWYGGDVGDGVGSNDPNDVNPPMVCIGIGLVGLGLAVEVASFVVVNLLVGIGLTAILIGLGIFGALADAVWVIYQACIALFS